MNTKMSSNPTHHRPSSARRTGGAWLGLGAVLLVLSGCAARQSVVLVPDPAGHVGTAEVSTAAGRQTLQKAGDMTQIGKASAPPTAITKAQADFITATFGEALAIEPMPAQITTLLFESGATDLSTDTLALLDGIVTASKRQGVVRVSISGHSDATGTVQLNNEISYQRAERVRALLLERGVPARLMDVSSHGKGNPLVPTADGVSEPRNRRVMVVVR